MSQVFAWRSDLHRSCEESVTGVDFSRELAFLKTLEPYAWLREVPVTVGVQSLRHQNWAFRAFFRGDARYPRYKSRGGPQSAQMQLDRRVARFTFRFQGARVDMRLGTWPEKSLAELRALRDRARTLVRAGENPRAAAREEKAQDTRAKAKKEARLTVRGLFDRWGKIHLRRAY